MGVYLLIERTIVTLAILALFGVLTLTGHMDGSILPMFALMLGLIGTAWFSAHQQSVAQVPPAAPVPAVPAVAPKAGV